MYLVTIIGLAAASITVASTIFLVYKRMRKLFSSFEYRLVAIEDSFKVREELTLLKDIVVKNKENNRLYTLKKDSVVIVYDIKNGIVDFVTSDRLIYAEANIECFIQEKSSDPVHDSSS